MNIKTDKTLRSMVDYMRSTKAADCTNNYWVSLCAKTENEQNKQIEQESKLWLDLTRKAMGENDLNQSIICTIELLNTLRLLDFMRKGA